MLIHKFPWRHAVAALSLMGMLGCGSPSNDADSNLDASESESVQPSAVQHFANSDFAADEKLAFSSALKEGGTCQTGADAYTRTVYPFVRNRCAACHNGAIERAPPFAVQDAARSYAVVLSRMNFDDIPNSIFIRTGGNMHCQNFGIDCATNYDDVTNVVTAWWQEGEKDCPRKGKYFTEALPLPANLPNRQTGYMPLRFRLGNINAAFGNAILEVEAQLFSASTAQTPGAYRFRAPRLATPDQNIHIGDIKVLINGKFNASANAFSAVDRVVNAMPLPAANMPLPHPVLSSKYVIVTEEQATGDTVSVSFEALEQTTAKACRNLTLFKQKVMPVLEVRNCQACHAGPTNSGRVPVNQRFNMNLTDEQLCAAFLQRVDVRNPMNSPLIDYALRGANQHPRIIPQVAEIQPAWTDWITSERTQFDDE